MTLPKWVPQAGQIICLVWTTKNFQKMETKERLQFSLCVKIEFFNLVYNQNRALATGVDLGPQTPPPLLCPLSPSLSASLWAADSHPQNAIDVRVWLWCRKEPELVR